MLNNFYSQKKILVTGHTGFKGSWLCLWLKNLGAQVTGYALQPPSQPSFFAACNLHKEINSIIGDIRNYQKLKRTIETYKPDIIFHLAAQSLVGQSYRYPKKTYETNTLGTVNLLEVCRLNPAIAAILNVTSDKCYAEKTSLNSGYREVDAMGGNDPYSSSKACSELITHAYQKSFFNQQTSSSHLASARAGNVIGGGDWNKNRLIPDCIKALTKNKTIVIRQPKSIRPWQFVLDPLYGYLLLAKKLYQKGKQFSEGWNFGPNKNHQKSVSWIVKKIIRLWNSETKWKIEKEPPFPEAKILALNSKKARLRLNWSPKIKLNEALEKTIFWYKSFYQKKNIAELSLRQIDDYEKILKESKK